MSTKHKRKQVVDVRYQFGRVAAGVAANVLVTLLAAGVLSWFYLLEMDGSVAYDHNSTFPLLMAGLAVVVVVVHAYFGFRRSRAVAGLMKKLRTVLNDAARGQLPEREIVFRRTDYFRDLAGPLNQCLGQLRRTAASGNELAVAELGRLIDQVEGGNMDQADLCRSLKELAQKLRQEK